MSGRTGEIEQLASKSSDPLEASGDRINSQVRKLLQASIKLGEIGWRGPLDGHSPIWQRLILEPRSDRSPFVDRYRPVWRRPTRRLSDCSLSFELFRVKRQPINVPLDRRTHHRRPDRNSQPAVTQGVAEVDNFCCRIGLHLLQSPKPNRHTLRCKIDSPSRPFKCCAANPTLIQRLSMGPHHHNSVIVIWRIHETPRDERPADTPRPIRDRPASAEPGRTAWGVRTVLVIRPPVDLV